jgi:hypothetical protein
VVHFYILNLDPLAHLWNASLQRPSEWSRAIVRL